MSIRPFIFAPHYLFGDEHLAHCVFNFQQHDVQALPIDVSKGHLCISMKMKHRHRLALSSNILKLSY